MALSLGSKKVTRYQSIGCVTILRYPVHSDGSYGNPQIIKSYNFVPRAEKKKKVVKKQDFKIEEEGEL